MIAGANSVESTVEIERQTEFHLQGNSVHSDSTRMHSVWNYRTSDASVLWCETREILGGCTRSPAQRRH